VGAVVICSPELGQVGSEMEFSGAVMETMPKLLELVIAEIETSRGFTLLG
jgi:hypothetical protein